MNARFAALLSFVGLSGALALAQDSNDFQRSASLERDCCRAEARGVRAQEAAGPAWLVDRQQALEEVYRSGVREQEAAFESLRGELSVARSQWLGQVDEQMSGLNQRRVELGAARREVREARRAAERAAEAIELRIEALEELEETLEEAAEEIVDAIEEAAEAREDWAEELEEVLEDATESFEEQLEEMAEALEDSAEELEEAFEQAFEVSDDDCRDCDDCDDCREDGRCLECEDCGDDGCDVDSAPQTIEPEQEQDWLTEGELGDPEELARALLELRHEVINLRADVGGLRREVDFTEPVRSTAAGR